LSYSAPTQIAQAGSGIIIDHDKATLQPSLAAEKDLRHVVHRLFNGMFFLHSTNHDANSFISCLCDTDPNVTVPQCRKMLSEALTPADVSSLRQICHSQYTLAHEFMDAKAIELFTSNKHLHLNEIQRTQQLHKYYQQMIRDENIRPDVVSMQRFADKIARVSIYEPNFMFQIRIVRQQCSISYILTITKTDTIDNQMGQGVEKVQRCLVTFMDS